MTDAEKSYEQAIGATREAFDIYTASAKECPAAAAWLAQRWLDASKREDEAYEVRYNELRKEFAA